jgi:hypothetical protein
MTNYFLAGKEINVLIFPYREGNKAYERNISYSIRGI